MICTIDTERPTIAMASTADTIAAIQAAGEDFEWYPTTQRMIEKVARRIGRDSPSIMDVGAGDGRVLLQLAELCKGERGGHCELFAIEKSLILSQRWPEHITPVGSDLFEQNLACLPVDYIFSNPPYSDFETWACAIIESGFARRAFLVIPRRWSESRPIAEALKRRGAKAKVIHQDDFHDAERRARAVVDIVEVSYPTKGDGSYRNSDPQDPFDIWFDQNIDTFDREEKVSDEEQNRRELARLGLNTIPEMVDAFNEEHARMEENYRAIFKLDYALLRELNVEKNAVREGIKKKMAGLKTKYWQLLFDRIDAITSKLATDTKRRFLEKLTGRSAIAFTTNNAYAVVLWAIKHANKYYDEQLVKLFRDLSTFEGVLNYKSNQKTWQKDGWRYMNDGRDNPNTHYALDYRIVVRRHSAIPTADKYGHVSKWESPGGLHNTCHELIDDTIAVLGNLGFAVRGVASRNRYWEGGVWEDFTLADGRVLFQAKAYKNGNLHFRFLPEAIRALNVEAGRLMGWLRSQADVVKELGYTPEEARKYFGANCQLCGSSVKLLAAPAPSDGDQLNLFGGQIGAVA